MSNDQYQPGTHRERNADTLVLLRQFAALQIVNHTHHPGTHVPVKGVPADDTVNHRVECPDGVIVPAPIGPTIIS